jgi:hypothetical protein
MKRLLFFVIVVIAAYLAWDRFGPSKVVPAAGRGDTTPAANASQRVDNLSGAAPRE